jgi:hypothetical protein
LVATGGWLQWAEIEARISHLRGLKAKPMTNLIFIAVIALFFVAAQLYACWCEKL